MRLKNEILDNTPNRLHPIIRGAYYSIFPDKKQDTNTKNIDYKYIPEYLPKKYISDTEIVPERTRLLHQMPKNGVVAELGVARGEFSAKILSIMNPNKLYLIDIWDSDRYDEECMNTVQNRFDDEIQQGDVEIVRQKSKKAMESFEDNTLDWVYLDTDHSYSQVSKELGLCESKTKELELCESKTKENGMIAGHDYCLGNPSGGVSYGVIEAVHEFCVEYEWKLSYLTLETQGHRTFVLERL
jgi:hypothetical protein